MILCICGGVIELLAVIGSVAVTSCCGTAAYNARTLKRLEALAAREKAARPTVELDARDGVLPARKGRPVDRDLARWIDSNTTDAREYV